MFTALGSPSTPSMRAARSLLDCIVTDAAALGAKLDAEPSVADGGTCYLALTWHWPGLGEVHAQVTWDHARATWVYVQFPSGAAPYHGSTLALCLSRAWASIRPALAAYGATELPQQLRPAA